MIGYSFPAIRTRAVLDVGRVPRDQLDSLDVMMSIQSKIEYQDIQSRGLVLLETLLFNIIYLSCGTLVRTLVPFELGQ